MLSHSNREQRDLALRFLQSSLIAGVNGDKIRVRTSSGVSANIAGKGWQRVVAQHFFSRRLGNVHRDVFTAVSVRFQVRPHSYRATGINFPRLRRSVETFRPHRVVNLCTCEIYKTALRGGIYRKSSSLFPMGRTISHACNLIPVTLFNYTPFARLTIKPGSSSSVRLAPLRFLITRRGKRL